MSSSRQTPEGPVDDESRPIGSGERPPGAGTPPAWLLSHRIAVPERAANYVDRPDLAARCAPASRRATLLVAPGGFGKTTLLAACCRDAQARGIPVAWLSADEADDAATLDTYLAYAFERAGLDIGAQLHSGVGAASYRRVALVPQAIEAAGGHCVLALDELERLTDPDAVALLDSLLRSTRPRLSVVIACRELPAGLDLAAEVLDSGAEVLTAEDLRFSKAEIARFFNLELSRRQLARVAERSSGWPIVLRLVRNEGDPGGDGASRVVRDVIANWMTAKLWVGIANEDRELVLDVGLFESFDADLLDEVLDQPGAMSRLDGIAPLAGLVDRSGRDSAAPRRLHPLLREHCAAERHRRTPDRYRSVHSRIAVALANRGRTVDAMRNAMLAGDDKLAGKILVDAGSLRLWLREGSDLLVVADRLLTPQAIAVSPRLPLLRCVALVVQGRLAEARRVYRDVVAGVPPSTHDPALAVDACLARAVLCYVGCEAIGSAESRAVLAEAGRIAGLSAEEPMTRAVMEYWRSIAHSMSAEFPVARECAARARGLVAGRSPYSAMALDFQEGVMAMAQGRVEEAASHYRRGRLGARACFLQDPGYAVFGEVLIAELALERSRPTDVTEAVRIWREVYRRGTLLAPYAAAAGVAAERTLDADGAGAAVAIADAAWQDARSKAMPVVERVLSGLRVSLHVLGGDVGAAERVWRTDALPTNDAACADLSGQTWREMEALAVARLRLLAARGEFDAARWLAAELHRVATARGLRRTAMRALALSMRTEHLAGAEDAAVARMAAFLELFAQIDYARAAVREGKVAVLAAERFLDANPASPLADAATRLLALARAAPGSPPRLSSREAEILEHLETKGDKQIAALLGLTADGVRYHVRRIFRKLDAHSRGAAVRRARDIGLLGDE